MSDGSVAAEQRQARREERGPVPPFRTGGQRRVAGSSFTGAFLPPLRLKGTAPAPELAGTLVADDFRGSALDLPDDIAAETAADVRVEDAADVTVETTTDVAAEDAADVTFESSADIAADTAADVAAEVAAEIPDDVSTEPVDSLLRQLEEAPAAWEGDQDGTDSADAVEATAEATGETDEVAAELEVQPVPEPDVAATPSLAEEEIPTWFAPEAWASYLAIGRPAAPSPAQALEGADELPSAVAPAAETSTPSFPLHESAAARQKAAEVADRLEQIARVLRERGPTGPLTDSSTDPLGALVAGYILGYAGSESTPE